MTSSFIYILAIITCYIVGAMGTVTYLADHRGNPYIDRSYSPRVCLLCGAFWPMYIVLCILVTIYKWIMIFVKDQWPNGA